MRPATLLARRRARGWLLPAGRTGVARRGRFPSLALAVLVTVLCAPAWGTVEGDSLRKLGFLVQDGFEKGFEKAPGFTTVDAGGNEVALADYRGKVVLLNFWATWCPPCRLEMPDMERLYREFRGQGLEIVAVNFMETRAQVKAFADEQGLSYPMLLDRDSEIARQYGVMRLPETVLIGRRGELIAKSIGYKPWYKDDVRQLMAVLLDSDASLHAEAAADGAAALDGGVAGSQAGAPVDGAAASQVEVAADSGAALHADVAAGGVVEADAAGSDDLAGGRREAPPGVAGAEAEAAGDYDAVYLAGAVILVVGVYLAFRRRRGRSGPDGREGSDRS